MPLTRITVFLSEDHMIVREGLRALLEAESDIQVVGEAENGRQAVERIAKLRPQVVVMDIAMPLLNGLEATRQILSAGPETRVIILSAYSDDAYVEKAVEIGAWGFLVKQTAAHILPLAIRKVHKGTKYFSPSISKRLSYQQDKSRELGQQHPKKDASQLSPREMEVLQLIAEGKANKETADVLHISVKTVEKHRQRLMDKLNIHDTASLTRYAISAGVIESSVQSSTSPREDLG